MGKPGIMLYFELRPCIEQMNQQEKAEMLDALMDYGEYGQTPELSEKLRMLWPLIRLKLDRDTDRYDRIVVRNQYAVYARDAARKNQPRLSYEQWKEQYDTADYPLVSSGDQTTNYKLQTTDHKLQTTDYKPQTINGGPPATPTVFSPPQREEILSFCKQENYGINVDDFMDHYSANGWMIGKSPMRDWKAAVRRWHRKENRNGTGKIEDTSAWIVGDVL